MRQTLTERRMRIEVVEMTEKELATLLIEEYTKLQRIKAAADRDKEIQYQLNTTKAKLSALGIASENLDIE
jgi:hypothetical protein